jgi:hypothetical protein
LRNEKEKEEADGAGVMMEIAGAFGTEALDTKARQLRKEVGSEAERRRSSSSRECEVDRDAIRRRKIE